MQSQGLALRLRLAVHDLDQSPTLVLALKAADFHLPKPPRWVPTAAILVGITSMAAAHTAWAVRLQPASTETRHMDPTAKALAAEDTTAVASSVADGAETTISGVEAVRESVERSEEHTSELQSHS